MSDPVLPEAEIAVNFVPQIEGGNHEGTEDMEQNEEEYIPLDNLAVELFEDPDEGTEGDTAVYTADMFNQVDSDYNEMSNSYSESYTYDDTSFQNEESSSNLDESREDDPKEKGVPLAAFNRIVKNVEIAEYGTLQILYQLLFQRSAWDTQPIVSQRILKFSGFTFSKNTEEYVNREVMLQSLPNEMLVKLGALLALNIRMMLLDADKAKEGLVSEMMEFLSRPQKKTRRRFTSAVADSETSPIQSPQTKCGCRSHCISKITPEDHSKLLEFLKSLEKKKVLDSYLANLIDIKKIIRPPGAYYGDLKRFRDVSFTYKVKTEHQLIPVCKGGFMHLHGIRISKLNNLQNKLKSGKVPKKKEFITFEEAAPTTDQQTTESKETTDSVTKNATRPGPKSSKRALSTEEILNIEEDLKEKIATNKALVPQIVVEKVLPKASKSKEQENKKDENENDTKEKAEITKEDKKSESKEEKPPKLKLKDFPLVVKSIDAAPNELLIDVHFLLFLSTAESDKVKENILEFSGFTFEEDTEEFDERNEFLQRMSNKIITDVSRCLSLGVMSTKEDTIKNILFFLSVPSESYLRTSAISLSLSDVELDDIGDMSDSDSDASITCEVVEKKVECIELFSSGEDSDKEDKTGKSSKSGQKEKLDALKNAQKVVNPPQQKVPPQPVMSQVQNSSLPTISSVSSALQPSTANNESNSTSNVTRCLGDFETICKIVNTHPHEYLVDIFELLYLKKHEPSTLRKDILSFTGFTFVKGTEEYVKRKQLLDRMLYNSVRRIYNTLIHNTTEVKVFSKPTMITEIFQFLMKLPDTDTSVRPFLAAKSTPKPTIVSVPKQVTVSAPPVSAPVLNLPNQTGKLSDLKRVFQRVACFPCEYLIDVHKLLFMTDCDSKTIRQNIFAFKGFDFDINSQEFVKRKMFLEYLTFHSLRKISSVLTTRSVDLRNSTKHELATHLTQVLEEYCHLNKEIQTPNSMDSSSPVTTAVSSSSDMSSPAVENIVVTPIIPSFTNVDVDVSPTNVTTASPTPQTQIMPITIVNARSVAPSITAVSSGSGRGRKRKSEVAISPAPSPNVPQQSDASKYADIHLPEVEQYCQLYGNIYATPTITGITTFNASGVSHQTVSVPIVPPYPQPIQIQTIPPPSQLIRLSTPTMISQVNKSNEVIVPVECVLSEEEPASKKTKTASSPPQVKKDNNSFPGKIRETVSSDEEDCDKPLASLIGHPIDSVLKKHIVDIVEGTNLQDITINGVIQKIYSMYPKFDLSYRKDFIKSTLRSMMYRLGEQKSSDSKSDDRNTNSPDCSVSTSGKNDSTSGSPENSVEAS